jgi:hypothetical protein
MSNKIKTVRIAPGYYNVKIGGITYEIAQEDSLTKEGSPPSKRKAKRFLRPLDFSPHLP